MVTTLVFWILASGMSVFFGWRARFIWLSKEQQGRWDWIVYQSWFNFAGSLAGWAALWAFMPKKADDFVPVVTWSSAALAVVAFAGITGHLPMVFWQAASNVGAFLGAVSDLAKKAMAKAAGG